MYVDSILRIGGKQLLIRVGQRGAEHRADSAQQCKQPDYTGGRNQVLAVRPGISRSAKNVATPIAAVISAATTMTCLLDLPATRPQIGALTQVAELTVTKLGINF